MLKSESVTAAEVRALAAEGDQYDLALTAVVDQQMRDLGITFRDLAERTAISEGTIWNRLRGGGLRPTEQYRVAIALGTTVAQLATDAIARMQGGRS